MTDLKKWFEANYLDGDAIQDGQTHSSSDCFEAVEESYAIGRQSALAEVRACMGERREESTNNMRDKNEAVGHNTLWDKLNDFISREKK